ncbi:MAG: D-glycero-beta-D-manno-heptose 1,7-bisphosphate 7-phosphatase [Calditrichia bacterium]
MNKAVFLDRDGVLIEDADYLDSFEKIRIYDFAFDAVRRLNEAGYVVVVVSNQSGIARGYFPLSFVIQTHEMLQQRFLINRARIDRFYFCPHHPEGTVEEFSIECECRKPKPGMILRAKRDFNLDLSRSFLIGDKKSDLETAIPLSVTPMLVRTGYGLQSLREAHDLIHEHKIDVTDNLEKAVEKILQA